MSEQCRWPEGCSQDAGPGDALCYWHAKLADGLATQLEAISGERGRRIARQVERLRRGAERTEEP